MTAMFVLTVSGEEHARRANFAITSYRKFTGTDVVVITDRVKDTKITGAHWIVHECPKELNNKQCSRYLKTRILDILEKEGFNGNFCYVDNDVFAVSPKAEEIFAFKKETVLFAPDPGKNVKNFSKYSNTGIDLHRAIQEKFGLMVAPEWNLWNGGVFLFDNNSRDFLHTWHIYTMQIVNNPKWTVRDQGTLVAAVWKHGMQDNPTLPKEFNWLHKLQGGLKINSEGFYSKNGEIALLHFPVTYGKREYNTWNKLVEMLDHV